MDAVGIKYAESANAALGLFKVFSAAFHVVLTVFLFLWVKRGGLSEKYGLFLPRYRAARAWFFLPLAAVCLYKVCFSPALRHAPGEAALWVVSMLGVGFLEELIFRGFLFRAIEKKSLKEAIIISSVTFGVGHIVNLLNGQDLFETVGQILIAVMIGFTLVILFCKGKSLVPCIVFHGVFNSLSVFVNDEAINRALGGPLAAAAVLFAACAVILGSYAVWTWKRLD